MASQNVPGVPTVCAFGDRTPVLPVIGWTGVATFLRVPLGGFAINLAAITAAISMGREAHEDAHKRDVAAIAAGVFYILIGLFWSDGGRFVCGAATGADWGDRGAGLTRYYR